MVGGTTGVRSRTRALWLPSRHVHTTLRTPFTEDYHWWWRAYLTSGSSALYLFLYSLFYFYTKLDITKMVPALMYFGEAEQLVISGAPCLNSTICMQHAAAPTHCPTLALPARLHDHSVGKLLLPHRHHRLLCHLHLLPRHLRRAQGGLRAVSPQPSHFHHCTSGDQRLACNTPSGAVLACH